jgi:serine/threonine-protein kinase
MIGRTIARYRIAARVGEGGMGVVYRARDERLQRDVAFKVLAPGLLADDRARRRFRQEALALSTLNHPNIQTVYDFDTHDEIDFLVTEYVEGVTLRDRVAAGGLPEKDVLTLGAQLADGLAAAHAQGIVHRDLKPDNLRVTPGGRLKILDFGLAHRLHATGNSIVTTRSGSETDALAGTVPYMAPEQLLGETVDARTDLYAAGCVLYELSTGRRPFADHLAPRLTDAILHQVPVAPRELNSHVSVELERIVLKCLEKEPNERYQFATELAVDLRRLQTGRLATAVVSAEGRLQRRRRVMWAVGVAVVALVALGLAASARRWWAAPGQPIRSVAVLPLANLMGADDQEYYVAAMHDAVIAELAQISALTVISRTSVMRYRNTDKAAPEIARELNVEALVEGSMFKTGDRVRVQVQLIRATPAERQLWSRTFDGELQSVVTLQSSVARAVAEQMQVTMTPQEAARLATRHRVDPAAYDAWAKGWFQYNRLTVEALHKCVEYAAAALAVDSSYAPAYALTASCQGILPQLGGGAPQQVFPKAKAAALRAIELDDSLADAHFALAWTLASYDWNWSAAEREYRRGFELNPGSALGHSRFSWFLSWLGRDSEAMVEASRAEQLNPTGHMQMHEIAAVHLVARRYDDAIVAARRAIDLDPTFSFGYDRLGRAYTEQAMYPEAIAALEMAVQLSGSHKGNLGRAYALSGRREDARRVLEELLSVDQDSPVRIATIYAALGQRDSALQWLERGYRVHDGNMVLLKVNPVWDSLRSDPRFQDLQQRMKFP